MMVLVVGGLHVVQGNDHRRDVRRLQLCISLNLIWPIVALG